MEPTLFIVVFAVLIIGIIVFVALADKKRDEALRSIAEDLRLSFNKKTDDRLLSVMQRFKLFNRGRGRKMKNVMQADTEAARLSIFDYQYTTGGGKSSQTHRFTLVSMEADELQIPSFQLRPEGFFDRIGSMFGGQDIDFKDDQAFSDAFVLSGNNEQKIRDFMTSELRELLLRHKDCYVECDQGVFIFYRRGRRKPEQIRELMDEAFSVYTAFRDVEN
ncbi:MAG: hypothetical protein AAF802_08105 [Planctomycetota bacterium]